MSGDLCLKCGQVRTRPADELAQLASTALSNAAQALERSAFEVAIQQLAVALLGVTAESNGVCPACLPQRLLATAPQLREFARFLHELSEHRIADSDRSTRLRFVRCSTCGGEFLSTALRSGQCVGCYPRGFGGGHG